MDNSTSSLVLINKSSKPDAAVSAFAAAVTKQIHGDVAPIWKFDGSVRLGSPSETSAGDCVLYLWDEPQTAADQGALGYHTLDSGARPIGEVFCVYAEQDGMPWTTVAGHEVLEALGDMWVNLWVPRFMPNGDLQLWPRELCDAVQGTSYDIDGVALSNFVCPDYFVDGAPGQKDKLGKLSSAFAIAPAGYSAILTIPAGSVPQQQTIYGMKHPAWRMAKAHKSRMARRPELAGRYANVDVFLSA